MTAAIRIDPARSAPDGVDPGRPAAARIRDYLLGGKDNYEVDRVAADRLLEVAPEGRTLAGFVRKFCTGAAVFAAEAGVRQFVDIGAGIPTSPAVHEAVGTIDTAATVTYVDYDPVVIAHSHAMVGDATGVSVLEADLRDPDSLLDRLYTQAGVDFRAPVCILLIGVLDHITDDEQPATIIARLREAMAPGSYLALTQAAIESADEVIERVAGTTCGSLAETTFRSTTEVHSWLHGFEILDPGVARIQDWLGDDLPATRLVHLGAIAHRPALHGGRPVGRRR
ncbi:hypothetical protein BJY24_005745 [Nocardia transvalensis]|uniref:S-adenosyl methyltransferase n=1 Tax=Nocardia transvalensis TaxID=37333 RepID=A0A7W9UKR5_9NOCA|nr:SAM-dependent methyltransferase [Nocardia transvalensis]MBB5916833.1 hypothetical protein [Nocardia transvalensis]